jgi:hypothetical protein
MSIPAYYSFSTSKQTRFAVSDLQDRQQSSTGDDVVAECMRLYREMDATTKSQGDALTWPWLVRLTKGRYFRGLSSRFEESIYELARLLENNKEQHFSQKHEAEIAHYTRLCIGLILGPLVGASTHFYLMDAQFTRLRTKSEKLQDLLLRRAAHGGNANPS